VPLSLQILKIGPKVGAFCHFILNLKGFVLQAAFDIRKCILWFGTDIYSKVASGECFCVVLVFKFLVNESEQSDT